MTKDEWIAQARKIFQEEIRVDDSVTWDDGRGLSTREDMEGLLQDEPNDWRPIETAPKDMEDGILAWGPNGFVVAFWDDSWVDVEYGPIYPTHWMPPQEAPK